MMVSKVLPCVENTAVPDAFGLHLNQMDLPPGLPGRMSGSPDSLVAFILLLVTTPLEAFPKPKRLANLSLPDAEVDTLTENSAGTLVSASLPSPMVKVTSPPLVG